MKQTRTYSQPLVPEARASRGAVTHVQSYTQQTTQQQTTMTKPRKTLTYAQQLQALQPAKEQLLIGAGKQ